MDANKKRNIILVGNSVELLQYDFGKYIDSFDTVVRFGRGVPTEDNSHAIGKKTDMWITGFLRMGSYHCFPGAEILFNRCRIHLDLIPKKTIPFDKYTDMFSDEELMKIFNKIGAEIGVAEGQRPSAGFLGILYFLQKCEYNSLTIIGFDFFAKKLPINTGMDYPSSWHMPINSISKTPHNAKEKQIVSKWQSEGKLNWKILSDLKEELLKFT